MYYENYVGGFSCSEPECHSGLAEFNASAGPALRERTLSEVIAPLSMSQQMLMLCFISGQIEHSAWDVHLKEDPVLAAHFSLMSSSRQRSDRSLANAGVVAEPPRKKSAGDCYPDGSC